MIQTVVDGVGGTLRLVLSYGRPNGGSHDYRVLNKNGEVVASASGVVQAAPDTTVATAADKGSRVLQCAGALTGYEVGRVQRADSGARVYPYADSFEIRFSVGTPNTNAYLHEPLPRDIAIGESFTSPEVTLAVSAADTAAWDVGLFYLEITCHDELGVQPVETERFAITTATLVQPCSYQSLVRRYPVLGDQQRVEDPSYAVALDTALMLCLERLEQMGLDWWNLRTWQQLEQAVAARCYANELKSWGPEWATTYDDAREEAEAYLRDVVDRLAWVDSSGKNKPIDPKPDLRRIWVER